MKVCETADFLAAVVPEAATETRTAPAPAIGACMTRAIAAATTISVIVNPNAAAPMSVVMTVIMVVNYEDAFRRHHVMVHFLATTIALVLHLLTATTPTTPAAVIFSGIFSGDRCGSERETSGQRQ